MTSQQVRYTVGEEKGLLEILRSGDVVPLLREVVRAGVAEALLLNAAGEPIRAECNPAVASVVTATRVLRLEGEPVGTLVVSGREGDEERLDGLAGLLWVAINTILANNLKRMLTTEMHTAVVSQSYDDLLAANERLTASEARYRELAETLDSKVKERTAELERAHARLLQQENMAAIGQLAAGVAHEINNPLGFITSNLSTLQKYVSRFVAMLEFFRNRVASGMPLDEVSSQCAVKWNELKLDMVLADIGDLLSESLVGAERVSKIVADLKGFSHVDAEVEGDVDVNEELDRTLSVLTHQIPPGTEIFRDYGLLKPYSCRPTLLCQIFLNIVRNALVVRQDGLKLTLATRLHEGCLTVTIADNGPGIPLELRSRIFEPFYTTRQVGAGTGMGLAVVYDSIRSLQGEVGVDDAPGGGARFTVTLPLQRNIVRG
ncbi:sensor histidine kinase [Geobacter argillaceus]|uniref:histidine kinase n=1 Tax=Geobacter argillaceus TaxID=345631 RepID=A0A562VN90_9BACT|nr:ATP-binding protein [Geobacter argillaceus]TWJ19453.1 hypothetical protein JN12_01869 [Geobacter argillaceus]